MNIVLRGIRGIIRVATIIFTIYITINFYNIFLFVSIMFFASPNPKHIDFYIFSGISLFVFITFIFTIFYYMNRICRNLEL